jgi:hypothetical protein
MKVDSSKGLYVIQTTTTTTTTTTVLANPEIVMQVHLTPLQQLQQHPPVVVVMEVGIGCHWSHKITWHPIEP